MNYLFSVNSIFQCDCKSLMSKFPNNFIDLIITSPPYDNLRKYGDKSSWSFDFFETLLPLFFNKIKNNGVIVWVVSDATINGSETGTSFMQALEFIKIGFNLHDTMIYKKINYVPLTHNRYEQEFEYMFIFSKGKPKTFNPKRIPCKTAGMSTNKRTFYQTSDDDMPALGHKNNKVSNNKIKGNIWEYSTGGDKTTKGHPAVFPLNLALDHIETWSNQDDIVFDPFLGSGTVCVAAKKLKRKYIGCEINPEYFNIAKKRLGV